jgi:hypothetical protein
VCEREKEGERESVCVREKEREKERVCVRGVNLNVFSPNQKSEVNIILIILSVISAFPAHHYNNKKH